MAHSPDICVVIAARNARSTIKAAVASALAEPEVAEVVLVDDASTDDTASEARAAARGDARLQVIAPQTNLGPAAARNLAIDRSKAPLIAVLDADDRFVAGRFAHLLSLPDWDIVADNIAFVQGTDWIPPETAPERTETLDLTGFVRGNISKKGVDRGELGFLKPVIRREFLVRHGLAYDPALRLGEDYDLYVRCLLRGARFRMSHRVGYVAEVRANSLSGQHGTGDLAALLDVTGTHLEEAGAASPARAALLAHQHQIRKRHGLRAFLDLKAQAGLGAALGFALRPPSRLPAIAAGVLSDKIGAAFRTGRSTPLRRTLIPLAEPARF
jgi:succinoglycan biosynthesis protein ExoU